MLNSAKSLLDIEIDKNEFTFLLSKALRKTSSRKGEKMRGTMRTGKERKVMGKTQRKEFLLLFEEMSQRVLCCNTSGQLQRKNSLYIIKNLYVALNSW